MNNNKNFLLGAFAGYLFTAVNMVVSFISVRISLKYFGIERYGALAIIASLLAYLSTTNFGIPTAVNILAAKALRRLDQIRVVQKAFVIIALISCVMIVALIVINQFPNWVLVLGKIPQPIFTEVRGAAFLSALLYLIALPFSVFLGGFIAIQKVYVERIYSTFFAVIPLGSLLITKLFTGDLVFFSIIRGAILLGIFLIIACHFAIFEKSNREVFVTQRDTIFKPSDTSEFNISSILSTAFSIFILSLSSLIIWHANNFIVSHFINVQMVTPFSIAFGLITSSFFIFSTIASPVGPMFGLASAKKDFEWITRIFNQFIVLLPAIGGMIWIGSICFAKDIIYLWVGASGYPGFWVIFAISGYGYVCSMATTPTSLANSMNMIFPLLGWIGAAIHIILSVVLIQTIGLSGVAFGIMASSFCTVWVMPILINRACKGNLRLSLKPAYLYFLKAVLPVILLAIIIHFAKLGTTIERIANCGVFILYGVLAFLFVPKELKQHIYDRYLVAVKIRLATILNPQQKVGRDI